MKDKTKETNEFDLGSFLFRDSFEYKSRKGTPLESSDPFKSSDML